MFHNYSVNVELLCGDKSALINTYNGNVVTGAEFFVFQGFSVCVICNNICALAVWFSMLLHMCFPIAMLHLCAHLATFTYRKYLLPCTYCVLHLLS